MLCPSRFNRRTMLAGMAAMPLLFGCRRRDDDGTNPPDSPCTTSPGNGDVTWIPDVARPASWGASDVGPANGAPRPMMIYYPAARRFDAADPGSAAAPDPTPEAGPNVALRPTPILSQPSAPMLKLCSHRWPVVLLLHGRRREPPPIGSHYRSWRLLPSTLARCGFVVVVPSHRASNMASDADVEAARADVAWVRTRWSGGRWVEQQPRLAVVAHSNGSFVALRLAAAQPATTSLTTLGMPFHPRQDILDNFRSLQSRVFLMYAEGVALEKDITGLWPGLTIPKYFASYRGEHFDYLPPSETANFPRGPCPLIGRITADLVTLFISTNLGPFNQVASDLARPAVALTPAQQSYAEGHFRSFGDFACAPNCLLNLQWQVGEASGSRVMGLPGDNPAPCAQP